MKVVSLTSYMETKTPSKALESCRKVEGLTLIVAGTEHASLLRSMYHEIGKGYVWVTRLNWTVSDWEAMLADERRTTWIAEIDGEPAGFFEIARQTDGSVNFIISGVRTQFRGRGIGTYLLCFAIEETWKWNPTKLTMAPRSFEHERAMPNYVRRGFQVVKVRPKLIAIPRNKEAEIREFMEHIKKRGDYPPFMKRIEAHLRECLAGRAARWAVYYARCFWRRLKAFVGPAGDRRSSG